VEASEREQQRLEQDLHDGAQQRLMAIQIKLRMAQTSRGKTSVSFHSDDA